MRRYGEVKVNLLAFLSLALDEDEWSVTCTRRFTLLEKTYHYARKGPIY
jgi:hypothetical protein